MNGRQAATIRRGIMLARRQWGSAAVDLVNGISLLDRAYVRTRFRDPMLRIRP